MMDVDHVIRVKLLPSLTEGKGFGLEVAFFGRQQRKVPLVEGGV